MSSNRRSLARDSLLKTTITTDHIGEVIHDGKALLQSMSDSGMRTGGDFVVSCGKISFGKSETNGIRDALGIQVRGTLSGGERTCPKGPVDTSTPCA